MVAINEVPLSSLVGSHVAQALVAIDRQLAVNPGNLKTLGHHSPSTIEIC